MENRIREMKIELALRAIDRDNLSMEDIAETLDLPLETVQELATRSKPTRFPPNEKLDYTEWQRSYFDAMVPGEFHEKALEYAKAHPYSGNAERLK